VIDDDYFVIERCAVRRFMNAGYGIPNVALFVECRDYE
jgi:hypothetical protein